jgi:secreted trypsin-like serine protease
LAAHGVTGGEKISVRSAPWAVYIGDAFAPDESFGCSGSIIDASHILTAAHCLFNLSGIFTKPSRLTVVAGVSDFRRPGATDARQERRVRSMRVYPGYFSREPPKWSDIVHDLAVLELSRPLDLSGPTARSVALASPGDVPSGGSRVAFAGFGRTNPRGGDGPLELLHARIIPRKECTIIDGILCASSVDGENC